MNKDKAIWLFAGGAMQEAAARRIHDFGYRLLLTDMNAECVCAKYADAFVPCDTFDVAGNSAAAKDLAARYDIRACLTLAADCHETVAHLCRQLGLHGISPRLSHLCRQKHLTRAALAKAGLPQPKFFCVTTFEEAREALRSLGGNGVIKATDNSGSRGFTKLDSLSDLTIATFEAAVAAGTSGKAIIEEAITPNEGCIAELSVETLWNDGEMFWLNWVDRLFRADLKFFPSLAIDSKIHIGWAVELGHINPAVHPLALKHTIFNMIMTAGKAIGMQDEPGSHILKADIMLSVSGPVIIELTPRLSGGWDSSGTTPARGADFQGGVIQLALGEKLDIALWHRYFEFQDPSLYATIVADVAPGANNCIGRKFTLGCGYERDKALQSAYNNMRGQRYVV